MGRKKPGKRRTSACRGTSYGMEAAHANAVWRAGAMGGGGAGLGDLAGSGLSSRQWLAPIIEAEHATALIRRVVPETDLDAAIAHIRSYGSEHTDVIVTNDYQNSQAWVRRLNSSTVGVNCSTAFADGYLDRALAKKTMASATSSGRASLRNGIARISAA